MVSSHLFLLTPGVWLGEGKIELNMAEETLIYFTRWKIDEKDGSGNICCLQQIEIKGLSEIMNNEFVFSSLSDKDFEVEIENESIGRAKGKGFISNKMIGWEFSDHEKELEGFEFYERQEDNSYLVCAEYATSDQFRTEIRGKIWQKGASS